MKKVYGLLLLLAISKIATAQDEDGGFKASLRITPSFLWTKVDVDDPTNYAVENDGVKLGFAYGIMGDYFFNGNYALSTELRIAHLGAGFTVTDRTGADDVIKNYNLRMQFLEIPLTFKMQTKEIGYMRYYGQFGVMSSFRLKAKQDETISSGNTTIGTTEKVTVTDKLNPIGLGLVIGAGTTYSLGGTTSLLGGVSFHNGFTNLVKVKEYNAMVKPAYIAVNLGVIF